MKGILYICHGSNQKAYIKQAVSFTDNVKSKIDVKYQQICFLEKANPTIEQGVQILVEQGVTSIVAIPVFLLSAKHVKVDIPSILRNQKKKYPFLDIKISSAIGVDERIVDILYERIIQRSDRKEDSLVLLVGRGSSDNQAIEDFKKIALLFKEKYKFFEVRTCFLAAVVPTFKQELRMAAISAYPLIFIVPYLLFSGTLIDTIEEETNSYDKKNNRLLQCKCLGFHPILQELLIKRIHQELQG